MKNIVNDIHSQLNLTKVKQIVKVTSIKHLQKIVKIARQKNLQISVAGGRHSMGGQQFGTDTILIDMNKMNRVLDFDNSKGLIHVGAGIQWTKLINYLVKKQKGSKKQWGIAQKQTGADNLSLGGSIASNVHGRGLKMKPIISNVESFLLVNYKGDIMQCSRKENYELFCLVIGGYGLFGVVASVTLRLVPRTKMERIVKVITLEELMPYFKRRMKERFKYGDFQFYTDETGRGFMENGIFSTYKPAPNNANIPKNQKVLTNKDWKDLLFLAHTNEKKAVEGYTQHYISTSGQIYWSDIMQLSTYIANYHKMIDKKIGAKHSASEIITEIYVPRDQLVNFMKKARNYFLTNNVNIIYGTIRLIEKDTESFLAWAKKNYACIIFNVHTVHTKQSINHSARAFRKLIDFAMELKGSYFLTYHKFATKKQIEACYPQFKKFLELKKKYDPIELFRSDWYRHYKRMFSLK